MIVDASAVLAILFSAGDAATAAVQRAGFPADRYHGRALKEATPEVSFSLISNTA